MLRASATDEAGNRSAPSAPVAFTLDTLAPAAPDVDAPVTNAFVRTAPTLVSRRAEPGSRR